MAWHPFRNLGLKVLALMLGTLLWFIVGGEFVVERRVQVALEFHRRHRARVKGLVLLCGSYGTPLDTWHDHTLLRVAFPFLLKTVERAPELARRKRPLAPGS